ncbi:hypothetical protein DPMN_079962 [Dreissena polymorpha]|uniref:Uncharacterized protein n=1 Tax=Dreissena polymorpha TaxID=45954 RepID=A0A9D3YRQ6_DREPO|nr:hypothetical protein DPMN_079962 [Dreissena polymorpha]
MKFPGPTYIIGTNLLTKFHDDWTINMASRVLTRTNATPPWRQYIVGTNRLTRFHDDLTINVASRVLIILEINVASRVLTMKNSPPHGGHVFQPTKTIFKLIQNIIGSNLLTKFHEDRKINVASRVLTSFYYRQKRKNAPPPGGHVFQPTSIIFLILATLHEDRTIHVASRVLTRLKNALPLGSHVFQANITIFKLIRDIIEKNLLTKFHEDWTINVASRELTRQMLKPHNQRRTKGDYKSSHEHVVLR